MSIHIDVQIADELTPMLRQLQAKLSVSQMTSAMRTIGIGLAALTKRAFDDPSLRPSAWPAKKDGSTATLRRKGMLWRSPRVVQADASHVTIGSDRPYAAIHQLGFSGQAQVRSHLRRVKTRDQFARLFVQGKLRRVRTVTGAGGVQSHRRTMSLPSRPFFPVTPDGTPTDAARLTIRDVLAAYLRLH